MSYTLNSAELEQNKVEINHFFGIIKEQTQPFLEQ